VAKSFAASVDAWAKKSRRRATAIFRESAKRVAEEANRPVGQGGKTPVDTEFLVASFRISLDGMPFGQNRNPGKQQFTYDESAISLRIAGAEIGDTIWGGWTAEYAPFMEYRYAFLRSAAQNWSGIVRQVVAEAKARYP
jgi:hypothetical protein